LLVILPNIYKMKG